MYKQVELKYDFKALEPHIDELTMITHYTKHHAAYMNNFNAAAEKAGGVFEGKPLEGALKALDGVADEGLRTALRNNGGGLYNHNIYFDTLSPEGGGRPEGRLAEAIDRAFGSFEAMKEKLSAASMGRFGSGWGWLSANAEGELQISSSPNQDSPLIETKGKWVPIFGIDVWEHAYYLKYKNLRADYVAAIFNVADWKRVAERYGDVAAGK